jgi:hypothetical protein
MILGTPQGRGGSQSGVVNGGGMGGCGAVDTRVGGRLKMRAEGSGGEGRGEQISCEISSPPPPPPVFDMFQEHELR